MSYVWGTFHMAIHCLAGAGHLKKRVFHACMCFEQLAAQDLPASIRAEYDCLHESITREYQENYHHAVRDAIDAMGERDLKIVIARILQLYAAISKEEWGGDIRYPNPRNARLLSAERTRRPEMAHAAL